MRRAQEVRQGWSRTSDDLREMCAKLSDSELDAMLDRCLSTRLARIAAAEREARRNVA